MRAKNTCRGYYEFSFCSLISQESETDPDVFEGDMILTPEQQMAAINGWDVDAPLGRGGIKNRRWPGGVFVYQIDPVLGKLLNIRAKE